MKTVKETKDIMINGSTQEEVLTSENIHATNIEAPQYLRWMLTAIKGEINRNLLGLSWVVTIIVDLCIHLPNL